MSCMDVENTVEKKNEVMKRNIAMCVKNNEENYLKNSVCSLN